MSREADGWGQLDREEARMFRVMRENGVAGPVVETVAEVVAVLEGDDYVQCRENGRWVTYRGPR